MTKQRKNWFLRRMALAFAAAAIAAPAAQAAARPDDRADRSIGLSGEVSVVAHPDNRADRSIGGTSEGIAVGQPDIWAQRFLLPDADTTFVLRRDPGAAKLSPGPTGHVVVATRPDDRALRPGLIEQTPVQVVGKPSITKPDGFDWGDAGIGAAVAFGAMLLAAGAGLATRHVGKTAAV